MFGKKCINDVVIMNVGKSACKLNLSVHIANRAREFVLCTGLLLCNTGGIPVCGLEAFVQIITLKVP